MKHAVNLLQYPALDRQRRWRHRWTTSVAGGVVGVLLAWFYVQWEASQAQHIQQERQRLQAMLDAQKQQQQSQQKQQVQQAAWQQQVQHLQGVAQEHSAWEVLHQVLQREARVDVLQFLSLQLTQGQLVLQGRTSNLPSMNQARQRVSQDLGLELKLSSALLAAEPPAQSQPPAPAMVEFVWQGDWSALRSRSAKTIAVSSGGSAPRSVP